MIENRSVPSATIIPVLSYENVARACGWLCDTFGFRERLRVAGHRAQLVLGDGALIVTAGATGQASTAEMVSHAVHVRVADVDRHYEHSKQCGAKVLQAPESYPFGERQYTVEDLGGHRWTFSQSIADVAPEDWGGQSR